MDFFFGGGGGGGGSDLLTLIFNSRLNKNMSDPLKKSVFK